MNDIATVLEIVPASEASWEDLQAVLGTRGVRRGASASDTRCSTVSPGPPCGAPSGLVAFLDGEPVGWCAVEPRTAYPRMLLETRVPRAEREEGRADDNVWAVTCFVIRTGFCRRGVSRALAHATVDFARGRGARASRATR